MLSHILGLFYLSIIAGQQDSLVISILALQLNGKISQTEEGQYEY